MPSVAKNKFAVSVDLSDIQGKLLTLGKRLSIAVGRRGLLAGARVIGEEARLRAPKPRPKTRRGKTKGPKLKRGEPGYWATGNLAKSIAWETRGVFRNSSGIPVEHAAAVYIKNRPGKRGARRYAHLAEFGTKPHHQGKGAINTVFKRSKAKKNLVGGKHPGAAPRPFMRPALDSKADEAQRVIAEVTRQELAKELASLRTVKNLGKVGA